MGYLLDVFEQADNASLRKEDVRSSFEIKEEEARISASAYMQKATIRRVNYSHLQTPPFQVCRQTVFAPVTVLHDAAQRGYIHALATPFPSATVNSFLSLSFPQNIRLLSQIYSNSTASRRPTRGRGF